MQPGPDILDSSGKVQRRYHFDFAQVYKGDDEWSFAEVRARQRGLMGREWRGEVQDWERQWHAPGCELSHPLNVQQQILTDSFDPRQGTSAARSYAFAYIQHQAGK